MHALLLAIPPPPGNAVDIGPLTVHYYGLLIGIGVLVAILVARRRYTALGGDPELLDSVALWAVVAGVVGARLAFMSTNFGSFFPDRPWAVFAIWEGGLAFFGGLVLGALVGIVVLRRRGGDLAAFCDAGAPAIPLAQAIGRWGNYFNEELYGTATDLPWALELSTGETVHPTFLYESVWNILLATAIILLGRTRRIRIGGLIFVYAAGYGFMRFLLELIRTDTDWRLLGLSRNAYVALAVLLVGMIGLWLHQRRGIIPRGEPQAPDELVGATESEDGSGDDQPDAEMTGERAGSASHDHGRGSPIDERAHEPGPGGGGAGS